MTVSSQVASASFVANGTTTVFPCAFKVFDQAHVQVHVDSVLKALTTDYTVSGVGDDSFDVTFLAAPAENAKVSIARVVPLVQAVDYLENDEFPAETHERALDLLVMMIQQLAAGNSGKAIRFPASDPASLTGVLPAAASRAQKICAFDDEGEVVAADGTELEAFTTGDTHVWTAKQTFQGSELLELVALNPGPLEYGPILKLFADRATVATDDLLCRIDFEGRKKVGGTRQRFASINSSMHNADEDDGQMDIAVRIEGALVNGYRFDSAGLIPRAGAFWTDPGADEGPYTTAYRKVTPPANGLIGAFTLTALNSAGASLNFLKIRGRVVDATAGSEDSNADFMIYDGGVPKVILGLRRDGLHLTDLGVRIQAGAGSPEGTVTAPVGSIFLRSDGGAGTTFYVKQSGTGNTGWVAK